MEKAEFHRQIIKLRPNLMGFAYQLTNNSMDCEDLVQETYLRAMRFYSSNMDDDANLKALLFTVLKNIFINDYRRNKKYPSTDIKPEHRLSEDKDSISPISCLKAKEMQDIIESLADSYRVPFKMHIEGYKYEEIAKKLDINIGTVKSRIFFARKEAMNALSEMPEQHKKRKYSKPHKKMENIVVTFKNLCDILIKDHGYNKNRISIESKLTWPTMKKVMEGPQDDANYRGGTLDVLTDYIIRHADKLQGKKAFSPGFRNPGDGIILTKPQPEKEPKPEKKSEPKPDPEESFWSLMERASKIKPANVTIQILFK